jgi:SulP family sulfate permease
MQYMDQSGLFTMEDILIDFVSQGKKILLVNVLPQPKAMLERIDIIPALIPSEHVFESMEESLIFIKGIKNN